jgi:hypothetical protein
LAGGLGGFGSLGRLGRLGGEPQWQVTMNWQRCPKSGQLP